jgi:hypothetical protein
MIAVIRRLNGLRGEVRALYDFPVEFTVSPWSRLGQVMHPQWASARRFASAPLISGVLHAVALLALGSLYVPERATSEHVILAVTQTEPPEEPEPLLPQLNLPRPDDVSREVSLESLAMSVAPIQNDQALTLRVAEPTVLESADLVIENLDMPEGFLQDNVIVREGSIGEVEVSHVEAAVDHLTYEIATALEDSRVLVIWVMDSSASMVDTREQVAGRIERVYTELGLVSERSRSELLSAVVGFGQGCEELVGPTNDPDKVADAIRKVGADESGIENVFTTVAVTVDRYRPFRARERRKLMVIVWTDESGDDYAQLEGAVSVCRKLSAPVYVVGISAMFGEELGRVPYVHPQDGRTYMLPVNRGPESVRQERLVMPYWFDGPQLESLNSGLAPFGLARLTRETGGAYFIKDHAGDRSPFKLDTMRRYLPEYEDPAEYMRQVAASPLRTAVLAAVDITRRRPTKGTPQLEFAPTGDNFQQQLREAQETVAYNSQTLDEALAVFGPKGLEPARAAEESPRWRAWYDLTYGRLLAMRVRSNEYNWACAEMKGKGSDFVDKQSNRWRFRPDEKLKFGGGTDRQAAEATRLLRRCVGENQGTPWAVLAARELQHPLGFVIDERYVAPPPPPPPAPPRPNVPPPPNPPRNNQPMNQPRPEPIKLPKL